MPKKFVPKSGQIDFTNARWAPVINCVVQYEDKILLVKRSKELNLYPGYYNGISGFLDDQKNLREKVIEELREELGIGETQVESIELGEIFDQEASEYKKTWIVHPVLVKINTDEIILDWEASEFKWVTMAESKTLKLLPGFELVLEKVFKIITND